MEEGMAGKISTQSCQYIDLVSRQFVADYIPQVPDGAGTEEPLL